MKVEPDTIVLLVGDDAKPFDDGMDAFDNGLSIEDNPYAAGSTYYGYWFEGYKYAEENQKANKYGGK